MFRLVFFLILIQPFINKILVKAQISFDVYNELLTAFVFTLFMLKLINNKWKIGNSIIYFGVIFLYMMAVTIYRGNGQYGIIQLILYSQFFVYYFYSNIVSNKEKKNLAIKLKSFLDIIFIAILLFTLIEIPNAYMIRDWFGVKSFDRGIGGFYLISFFGSAPSLALFLSIYIILTYYVNYGIKGYFKTKDRIFVLLALLICVFTFSRKEVFLIIVFVVFFPYPYKLWILNFLKKSIIIITVGLGALFYYLNFFAYANSVALNNDYIRFKIAKNSWIIGKDYFPLGTGVGTFGSQMSLLNDKIYKQYDVGPAMLGYNGKRGPIYDAFWFTFWAEMGVGLVLIFLFFYALYISRPVVKNKYASFSKKYLIFYFIIIGFFSPVLISPYGYMVAILLGLMSGSLKTLIFKNNAQSKTDSLLPTHS